MSAFVNFECQVIRLLLGPHVEQAEIDAVLNSATQVSCEHSGSGYFLTVRHPVLAKDGVVYSEPLVMGKSGDLSCGFVVFVEQGELTLECHSWDRPIPEDFRSRDVEIECAV